MKKLELNIINSKLYWKEIRDMSKNSKKQKEKELKNGKFS